LNSLLRKLAIAFLAAAFPGAILWGQSNDRIDELLAQGQARLDSTAYILLSAGGAIGEADGAEIAMEKLAELGCIPAAAAPDSAVSVQDLSYYLMKVLGMKGGVMYSLLPGPRYAYRELDHLKLVNSAGGPFRVVSGEEVVRTLGQTLAWQKGAAK
jgi:hypothetical protein